MKKIKIIFFSFMLLYLSFMYVFVCMYVFPNLNAWSCMEISCTGDMCYQIYPTKPKTL